MKLTIALLLVLTAWAHEPKLIEAKRLPSDSQVMFTAGGSFSGSADFKWLSPKPPKPSHQWAYSAAFLAGATVVDAASSRGLYEPNPALGRGQFGARQEIIKGAIYRWRAG